MSHAVSVCHGEFGRAALYRLDRPIITHAHREGHLIFHVDGATPTLAIAGQKMIADDGLAAAISPWEPHSFALPDGGECLVLVLYIKPMWFLENSASAEYALKFGATRIRLTPFVTDLVRRLTALLLDDDSRRLFDALLFDLTQRCFDQSWRDTSRSPLCQARLRFNDFRVRRSLRLLQQNMASDTEIEDVARSVGLSRPHFFKLFKRQMGVTPNVYVNTLRSEQAIVDLLCTRKTVTDIGYDLGFSSQASFTRFFSSNVGIAPSEYRRVAQVS